MSKKVLIRQKIRSIQTTKKITHAIRLVSMSLYSKLEHQAQFSRVYVDKLNHVFSDLLQYKSIWNSDIIDAWYRPDACPIWIIVGTSKGLCGSLNSNLFRYISKAFEAEARNDIKFITIGTRATNFVKDHLHGEIICSYNDFSSSNYNLIVSDLITKMGELKIYFSSLDFYFTQPKSFFLQKPTTFRLLPVSKDLFSDDKKSSNQAKEIIWEQDSSKILDYILLRYIKAQTTNILLQALISEYTARFVAMDSSTTNAEKLLEKLTLQYNKIRQGAITREISELCASFMERQ